MIQQTINGRNSTSQLVALVAKMRRTRQYCSLVAMGVKSSIMVKVVEALSCISLEWRCLSTTICWEACQEFQQRDFI